MPRLFWKFFAIIWLTLGTIVSITILFVNFVQPAPFARELGQQQRVLVLSQAANILAREGEVAAERFVRTSEAVLPLGLSLSKSAEPGSCSRVRSEETRFIRKGGTCFSISVSRQASVVLDNLPLLLPWVVILIASTISAAALAQYIIRPVIHIRDGLSALARGRFDIRIGDKMAGRKDEVTALAHDFDVSAARLQELQSAQQRLFHDVSHELRSPLSRLQAVVGVLRQSPAKLDTMLNRMDREVERLDVLVGEVLTLAKVTGPPNLLLKTQTLDIVDLLNEILGDAAFEAQAREVWITPCLEGKFFAEVEGELVLRAFENVIRNAIKYTAERSQISVQCQTTADLLIVRIADQGPGVNRDDLERIFQPFSRGKGTVSTSGYGLGLAITRQAIERHGGRVYASLPQTGGLAVTIDLPRIPPQYHPRIEKT